MNPIQDKYGCGYMNGDNIEKKLFEELYFIKKQLGEIKEHMVDIDSLLSAEEKELVFRSFENEVKGKLIPLRKLEEIRISKR
jgi:hypothetical protein